MDEFTRNLGTWSVLCLPGAIHLKQEWIRFGTHEIVPLVPWWFLRSRAGRTARPHFFSGGRSSISLPVHACFEVVFLFLTSPFLRNGCSHLIYACLFLIPRNSHHILSFSSLKQRQNIVDISSVANPAPVAMSLSLILSQRGLSHPFLLSYNEANLTKSNSNTSHTPSLFL